MKLEIGDIVDVSKAGYTTIEPTGVVVEVDEFGYDVKCSRKVTESGGREPIYFFTGLQLTLIERSPPRGIAKIEAEIARLDAIVEDSTNDSTQRRDANIRSCALEFALNAIKAEQA